MLTGKDWTEAEGAPGVEFSHECMAAQVHHCVHGIIDGGVVEGKVCDADAIIDTATWGEGKVHYQLPLPGVPLGDSAKRADHEVGEGGEVKGPAVWLVAHSLVR